MGLLTILEFEHLQGPLMQNFKHQIRFQGLSRALKKWKNFQETFINFQGGVTTL